MTTSRDYIAALVGELARVGITEYVVTHGGVHMRFAYWHDGRRRTITFPASPSDSQRGALNCVGDLRRQLGIGSPERGKSNRPRKRRNRTRPLPIPDLSPRPDPFAILETLRK